MIDRSEIEAARARLGDRLRLTPVLDATVESPSGEIPVTFTCGAPAVRWVVQDSRKLECVAIQRC